VIRDNSRAIRDNWRYGASHRQILPILPPNHFVEPLDSNWTTSIYLRMQVRKNHSNPLFFALFLLFFAQISVFYTSIAQEKQSKRPKKYKNRQKNFITEV
jgi:hypothetical protein